MQPPGPAGSTGHHALRCSSSSAQGPQFLHQAHFDLWAPNSGCAHAQHSAARGGVGVGGDGEGDDGGQTKRVDRHGCAHAGPEQERRAAHGLHPHGRQEPAAGEALGGGHAEAGHRPGAGEEVHHF